MSTVRRRRLAATALATTALLTLGGCGTGFGAQTNQVYQAGIGANHRGEMDVLNTLFVANEDGSATLSASIVNNTDSEDALSSITATTLDGKELAVASTKLPPLPLPAGELTPVGGASDTRGFWITKGAEAGDYVRVTLTFGDSAPVTIEAPVVTRTAEYENVVEAETEPTPTPTADDETESTETETESTEESAE